MVIPATCRSSCSATNDIDIPIQYNSVDEPSQITYLRLRECWHAGERSSSPPG